MKFAKAVREHHCELRQAPRADERQKVVRVEVTSDPPSEPRFYVDCFGNRVDCVDVTPPHEGVVVRLRAEVETLLENPFAFTAVPPAQERRWLENELAREPRLLDFVGGAQLPEIGPGGFFAEAPSYEGKDWLMESVVAARDWIADRIEFDPAEVPERAPLEAMLERASGDAIDLSHALIALARSWNVPARLVTGYQDVSDEEEERSPSHAWAEVLIPGAGWRGFDVVNRLVVNDAYVAVFVGRDADDAVPLKMAYTGGTAAEVAGVTLHFGRQEQ